MIFGFAYCLLGACLPCKYSSCRANILHHTICYQKKTWRTSYLFSLFFPCSVRTNLELIEPLSLTNVILKFVGAVVAQETKRTSGTTSTSGTTCTSNNYLSLVGAVIGSSGQTESCCTHLSFFEIKSEYNHLLTILFMKSGNISCHWKTPPTTPTPCGCRFRVIGCKMCQSLQLLYPSLRYSPRFLPTDMINF